jgi:threonine synthase
VILATSHPAKKADLVEEATGKIIKIPEKLNLLGRKSDPITLIDPQLVALEGAIASCF